MPLDYHSLLTAFTLSGCGLAAAFLVSWLVSKKERFLMAWTIGVSLMALGVLIYAAYVTTMAPLLGAAGYTVLLIGLAFVFGAGREFRTQILPWRSMLAMAAGSSIVVAVPMLAGYNGIAILVLNLAASVILFVTAWDYWLGRAEARLAITLLTALYVLTGLSFIPCAVLLAIDGRWVLSAAPSNWAEDLNIAACLATLAGIGALSLALNQARLARGHKRDAETDALTGLLNRRALLDRIAGEVVGPAALIIFDIDHFKRINDLQGHLAGDEVLRAFGEILISNRSHGLAARLGGEEFALLMPHASLVSAAIVARWCGLLRLHAERRRRPQRREHHRLRRAVAGRRQGSLCRQAQRPGSGRGELGQGGVPGPNAAVIGRPARPRRPRPGEDRLTAGRRCALTQAVAAAIGATGSSASAGSCRDTASGPDGSVSR